MPGFSAWNADEVEGDYRFEVFVKPEENQTLATLQLHQKIMTQMIFQTIYWD
ncbi:MAG: hypothetical protein JJE17_12635 [Peptostreptococcaceae bacterium]|nr:hypothetical protein [Peptostreptococcaceae bacterium]